MEPATSQINERDQALPGTPMAKPTWRRGQEGETAIRVCMPEEAPDHDVEVVASTQQVKITTSLKRTFFKAFDAVEAQDAALKGCTFVYDHDLPPNPRLKAQKRKDSIRDTNSPPTSSTTDVQTTPSSSSSSAAVEPQLPSITLTTEPAVSNEGAAKIPKELEIDGNAGFDPHHTQTGGEVPKRTYLYKGKRYEVQGDEPEAWLVDVREAAPPQSQASMSSVQARHHSRSSASPNNTLSRVSAGRRRSPRSRSLKTR